MKKVLLFVLLLSASYVFGQTELVLTAESSLNAQIEADQASGSPADVYIAEPGVTYWWDATLPVNFDLHIKGSNTDWIGAQETPPVFVPISDDAGSIYGFLSIESGTTTIENILFTGQNAVDGGDILGTFINEISGTAVIIDNCSFSDFQNSVVEIDGAPELLSITDCIMINGFRHSSSPWGGHLTRMDVPGALIVIENNTYVNSGRLLGNGGRFYESKLVENHNTWLNAQTNAQEINWSEALMANNIFYNWSWYGRTAADVAYNYSITTFETYAGLALDSVSVYWGKNLLYRDPAIKDAYENTLPDSLGVSEYITWNDDVDTTVMEDDNTTIGKSYWDVDPEFAQGPGNLDAMLDWLVFKYAGGDEWPNWGVTSPITYGDDGLPVLSWPPAFDLSYSNEYLVEGGTDGLPVGDLNWFPEAKETYYANRDAYLDALRDSIDNATALYIPGDSLSERITEDDLVSVESYDSAIPAQFSLGNNYPNPFNPTTKINFELPQRATISLGVFNILGQKVYEVTQKELAAGSYTFDFDASQFSSGIYIYRLSAMGIDGQQFISSKKMTLMK